MQFIYLLNGQHKYSSELGYSLGGRASMYVQVCVLSTCVWQVVVVLLCGRLLVGLILSNRLQLTDLSHGVLDSLWHLQHNTVSLSAEKLPVTQNYLFTQQQFHGLVSLCLLVSFSTFS